MNRRFILPALYILLGAVLITCGTLQVMDSYWSGMGGALLCVGVVRLIQTIRYKTDTQYKEKMDTEVSDERNRFLRAKARNLPRHHGFLRQYLPVCLQSLRKGAAGAGG